MKKIILSFLILLPLFSQSQELYEKFEKLKSEMDYIKSKNYTIKTISISESGNWLILYEDFGYSYNVLPKSAKKHLTKLNTSQKIIKDFDFFNDTAWVCVSEHNAFAYKYAPRSLATVLKKLNDSQKLINFVAFEKGKWIVEYDNYKYAWRKISDKLQENLNKFKAERKHIKYASFYGSDGWIILYGKNNFIQNNIPVECTNALKKLKQKNVEINCVEFYNQAWIIVYNKNNYVCNF